MKLKKLEKNNRVSRNPKNQFNLKLKFTTCSF